MRKAWLAKERAALSAQNATGNWIKVMQRVPGRVALEAGELAKNPLRVGLSMIFLLLIPAVWLSRPRQTGAGSAEAETGAH